MFGQWASNKFRGHFATPLEYVISLIRWSLGCIRLLKQILSDTDNIVPFENTTPVNQNKEVKIKERRAGL